MPRQEINLAVQQLLAVGDGELSIERRRQLARAIRKSSETASEHLDRVLLEDRDTRQITVAQAAHTVGYVFQSPTQMLFAPTVEEELAFGPRNLRYDPDTIANNIEWALQTVHMEPEREVGCAEAAPDIVVAHCPRA